MFNDSKFCSTQNKPGIPNIECGFPSFLENCIIRGLLSKMCNG